MMKWIWDIIHTDTYVAAEVDVLMMTSTSILMGSIGDRIDRDSMMDGIGFDSICHPLHFRFSFFARISFLTDLVLCSKEGMIVL